MLLAQNIKLASLYVAMAVPFPVVTLNFDCRS
jgi:hypothetical protein